MDRGSPYTWLRPRDPEELNDPNIDRAKLAGRRRDEIANLVTPRGA
jgi:hypothetical protein